MFSMCSELTPRAPVPDNRIPQLMQPCLTPSPILLLYVFNLEVHNMPRGHLPVAEAFNIDYTIHHITC